MTNYNGYSESEVRKRLLFCDGSRAISFRYNLLNKEDVKIGELNTIEGSVSFKSLAQIKRTAKFKLNEYEKKHIDFLNDRIQPYMRLRMPKGDWIEWPLGIFLLSSPVRKVKGASKTREIEAYDKALILTQDRFISRYMIPKGSNYVSSVVTLVKGSGLINTNITENDAVLNIDKEYEIGITKLEAINDLLSSINYTSLHIDENGYATAIPYVAPAERAVEHVYKDDELSILSDEAEEELDLFNAPNVFVRVVTNPETTMPLKSVYINKNPQNIISTVSRGRSIVNYQEITDIASQQTLDEYVIRIASESSQAYNKVRITTALMPNHSYLNMLYLEHMELESSGKFTETSWGMKLKPGEKMTHEARKVVYI